MKRRVAGDARLIVWDTNNEHGRHGCVQVFPFLHPDPKIRNHRDDEIRAKHRTVSLARAMLAAGSGPARLAYVSDDVADFAAVCQLVRAWAQDNTQGRAPCTFLVEELGDVVPPGKAPRWWGMLLRAGRHRGIKVRAVGHSPREIDKTTLKQATVWRIHTLGSMSDAEYLGREIIGCDPAPLTNLPQFHWLEYQKHDIPRRPVSGVSVPI